MSLTTPFPLSIWESISSRRRSNAGSLDRFYRDTIHDIPNPEDHSILPLLFVCSSCGQFSIIRRSTNIVTVSAPRSTGIKTENRKQRVARKQNRRRQNSWETYVPNTSKSGVAQGYCHLLAKLQTRHKQETLSSNNSYKLSRISCSLP